MNDPRASLFILHSAFECLVVKEVNQRKADSPPHEAGLKLLMVSRVPKESPAMAFIRNAHDIAEWKVFVQE